MGGVGGSECGGERGSVWVGWGVVSVVGWGVVSVVVWGTGVLVGLGDSVGG